MISDIVSIRIIPFALLCGVYGGAKVFRMIAETARNNVSGTGWSGSATQKTWTGDAASSVSFSGDTMGMGMYDVTIVFTIEG